MLEAKKIKSATVSTFPPSICHEVMGLDVMSLVFWMLSFKPAFSLSSFTLIKRLFSSFTLSAFQFSHSVMSNSLRPHELQHARPPCPSPTPGVHSGLISFTMDWLDLLAVQRLWRVFSNTTVQKYQFFGAQLLYCPTLTSIHDYWKNHSFNCMDLCQQSNISAFSYAV